MGLLDFFNLPLFSSALPNPWRTLTRPTSISIINVDAPQECHPNTLHHLRSSAGRSASDVVTEVPTPGLAVDLLRIGPHKLMTLDLGMSRPNPSQYRIGDALIASLGSEHFNIKSRLPRL